MIKKILGAMVVLFVVAFNSSLSAGVGKYDSFPWGWNMPFSGSAYVTQGYGGACNCKGCTTYHTGSDYYAIDLSGKGASAGSNVLAPASGYVQFADWDPKKTQYFGNQVIVEAGDTGQKNGNRYIYRVAHLSSISVKAGWWVNKGDVLGLVGSTGNSTGAHIHFSIHRGKYDSYGRITVDSFPPSWSPGIDGFNGKCNQWITSEF